MTSVYKSSTDKVIPVDLESPVLVNVNNIHFPEKLIYSAGDGSGEGDAYRYAEYGKSIMTSYRIND